MNDSLRRELAMQEMKRLATKVVTSQMPVETASALVESVERFLADPDSIAIAQQRKWAADFCRAVRAALGRIDFETRFRGGEYLVNQGIEVGNLCGLIAFTLWSIGVIENRNRVDCAAFLVRNEANGFAQWLAENSFPTLSEMLVDTHDAANDRLCPPEIWSAMVAGK